MIDKQDHPPAHDSSARLDDNDPPPPYQFASGHAQENIAGAFANRDFAVPQGSNADGAWTKGGPIPYAGQHSYHHDADYSAAPHMPKPDPGFGSQSSSPYAPPTGPPQVYGGYDTGNNAYAQTQARYVARPRSLMKARLTVT